MNRKLYRVFGILIVLSLFLAACGGGAAPATPAPVESTGRRASPAERSAHQRTPDDQPADRANPLRRNPLPIKQRTRQ